jgi:hypothetical protein
MKCGNEGCENQVAYEGDHLCQACFVRVLSNVAVTLNSSMIPKAAQALQKRPS